MNYYELYQLILLRGETPPTTNPVEFRGATFKTEGHVYVCSSEGTVDGWKTKWSWSTAYAIEAAS
jgi:hypothetical protein